MERAELEEIITGDISKTAPPGRRVGLYGMGGVGKSALAVDLANRSIDHWPTAQLYVELRGADPAGRPPMTPAEAMGEMIRSFYPDVPLPNAFEALTRTYRSVLAEADKVMVFLDDAADAAQVKPLLPPPNCALIVTSRNHLDLDGVLARDIECLTPPNARALLLEHAPRLADLADETAKLCENLPLALRAFAGIVRQHKNISTSRLVDQLRSGRLRLDRVEAVFSVSYALLDGTTQRRWTLLSIFPVSFTVTAVAAIWQEETEVVEILLTALLHSSLVESNETAGRYRLHDLVRKFCSEKLSPTEADAAQLLYAQHYTAVGESADTLFLRGGDSVTQGLALFDTERSHLGAAFVWLASRSDHQSAKLLISLVNAVAFTSDMRLHSSERVHWLEAQCRAAQITGDRSIEGIALGNLGNAHLSLGDAHTAIDFHKRALAISKEIKDRRNEGQDLGNLGVAHLALGDARTAISFHEQCRSIAQETGNRRSEGIVLGNLGNAHAMLGDAHIAIGFYEQRLEIAREIGDRRGEGIALWNSATEFWQLGERQEAIERAAAALAIHEAMEDSNTAKVRSALAHWRDVGGTV